jgi:tetratricopeptide (TPR) repeat protein
VNFHIGNCHYRLKDYEAAVKFFGKEFDGEDARQCGQKHNNLGSCYAHLNQSRLSLRSYSQALKIYADFPEIDCANLLNNLAMLYAQSAMYETAERYLLKSIEERRLKSPENSNALYLSYLHLANCQKHVRKYLEAIGSLSSALALAGRGFGSEGETLLQLAGLYEMVEQWTDALDCY